MSGGLATIFKLVSRTNKYIDEAAPWSLAKQAEQKERLNTVLYTMVETLRLVAVMLVPFLVDTPIKIWEQLGAEGTPTGLNYQDAIKWGWLKPGTQIHKGNPIFPRIEQIVETTDSKLDEVKNVVPSQPVATPQTPEVVKSEQIGIEDFTKIDLRVAQVLTAEKVEGSEKLLKLQIKVMGEERQIIAGIAQHYQPEQLIGKEIVVVANLKPAKLRGLLSEGMLLAATNQDGKLAILRPEQAIGEGAKVK